MNKIIVRCELQKEENGWTGYCWYANGDETCDTISERWSDFRYALYAYLKQIFERGDILACLPVRVSQIVL